jgi:hypothetical protein
MTAASAAAISGLILAVTQIASLLFTPFGRHDRTACQGRRMHKVLFSQGTRAVPLNVARFPAIDGSSRFRATAKRQMRFDFVTNARPLAAISIRPPWSDAIELGCDSAASSDFRHRHAGTLPTRGYHA